MRTIYFLSFCAVIALSSCSSSYRTGQTPDDVYYSPAQRTVNSNNGEYYNANPDDQYLMMKAQDPNRWSYFDDYSYYGSSYYPYSGFGSYGFYGGYAPWVTFGYWNPYYGYLNSYYMWNSFYNPYYGGAIVVTKYPMYNSYTQLHPFALTSYTNTALNTRNSGSGITRFYTPAGSTLRGSNNFNNFNNRNSFNNRNNFNNQNNFNRSNLRQSNFQQPTRSFTPSSFGGGSGGGGGRSFSRPGRG